MAAGSNLDDSQLCESLVKWVRYFIKGRMVDLCCCCAGITCISCFFLKINTFDRLQGNRDSVLGLSDGVAIASCLCQL